MSAVWIVHGTSTKASMCVEASADPCCGEQQLAIKSCMLTLVCLAFTAESWLFGTGILRAHAGVIDEQCILRLSVSAARTFTAAIA